MNISKTTLGHITLGIGLALLGLNIADGPDASLIGVFGSIMLIIMGVWDYIDAYVEVRAQMDVEEQLRQERKTKIQE